MSELLTANQRYNMLLERMETLRADIRIMEADKLDEAIKEIEKIELVLKQIEDLYGEELM